MNKENPIKRVNFDQQHKETPYHLALFHEPWFNIKIATALKTIFPSWHDLFNSQKSELTKLGLPNKLVDAVKNPAWEKVESDLKWLEISPLHHIITFDSPHYPAKLKEIATLPTLLFVHGDLNLLHTDQLAMVGSRNPSLTGLETAYDFAVELASIGLTITSGLAIGIDSACHEGAIAATGKTIAVMGTGIDHIYPRRNIQLAEKIIAKGGAIISEFPRDSAPIAKNFPRRNRIISGLSLGTFVVEATLKSGSLITANLATEQGREVFAIPGSIHNPLARGCHTILRQGAKLVEAADDIIDELKPLLTTLKLPSNTTSKRINTVAQKKIILDQNNRKLLECIGDEATSVDLLASRCRLKANEVLAIITNLELLGLIRTVPGGVIKCAKITS